MNWKPVLTRDCRRPARSESIWRTNLKLALLDGENRIRARLTVPTGGAEGTAP